MLTLKWKRCCYEGNTAFSNGSRDLRRALSGDCLEVVCLSAQLVHRNKNILFF